MHKIVIIANGEPLNRSRLKEILQDANYIIAADGGIYFCIHEGIIPDCIIGDMDSAASVLSQFKNKAKVIQLADQNSTDMEKALKYAAVLKPQIIEVINCFGKRTDHSLANIFILNNYNHSPDLLMHDDWGVMQMLKPGKKIFSHMQRKTISLFAIGEVKNISLKGFLYPLEEKEIEPGFIGLSNQVKDEMAEISFTQGRLILYELNED